MARMDSPLQVTAPSAAPRVCPKARADAARAALRQGRTLYVVDNDASGNRALLEEGARPLASDLSDLAL